ncbi:PHP domain-containing protein [Arsenicicoccus sp. oral taxon 190]|uniref:PHP domain-containing protein n=1 Tax=Arsenicicoccus sp. oral taxon 190 TaxID=1658671 RepID=UPI00067A038A|nr:PHP domain-containing protein [Arsenicicoccus sp. oral taxon 190]AKT52261.1 histidinol phosphatase [Arsenicicoccus sp. oral taxon 190]
MGHHHHDHPHGHAHPHTHSHDHDLPVGPAEDLRVPDAELAPSDLGRRNFLRAAGVLGAGVAAAGFVTEQGTGTAAAAEQEAWHSSRRHGKGQRWLAGDHHIHTQFSSDGKYRVIDHVQHASAYGLDWMVITDHGSDQHAKIGVDTVNPLIQAARKEFDDMLVFQGLEWNIPAAEHGTVFVHPGANEVAVLKTFENSFDGSVKKATGSTPANEALALQGLAYLASAVGSREVKDALMLANHPARKGIDSPHEIRGWRDAPGRIAVGMEGAPGHQAAGLPKPSGPGSGRGYYDNAPGKDSFAGYPLESYRTFGGFDWMTATVGGLWDSLLAEGKPWWITANSDSHSVYLDTAVRGGPDSDFAKQGYYADPVNGPTPDTGSGDYWPGYYSRTHVGADRRDYASVMQGLRDGRVWVDHGRLVQDLDVRVRAGGREVGLGGVLTVKRGTQVELVVRIRKQALPNWAQFVPQLAKVDAIGGMVTGPVADRDTFTAPQTRVLRSWDVSTVGAGQWVELRYGPVTVGDAGVYVRLRGSDGKRTAPGLRGAAVDPAGPAIDVEGNANPWDDLWFYTNPIWVLPRA